MFSEIFEQSEFMCYNYGVSVLYEDIIKLGKIELQGLNIDKLNKQYNQIGIFFHPHEKVGQYKAHFNQKTGEIHIYFNDVSIEEVEAILSHELLHKEQYKRGPKWYNSILKEVGKINEVAEEFNRTNNKKLFTKHKILLDHFLYGSPQEQMAYALQFVKERKKHNFKTPNDIVQKFKKLFGSGYKKFGKYVYMYWLIRDKI